ncbi:hypothetical protein EEL34_13705 [Muribaculaceae bacterium Isolate-039 (Harlan)]|nr:hypothetical protein EEL34_13705 [Muribaculaceae bacterium Isolate-039 (Harlan)]
MADCFIVRQQNYYIELTLVTESPLYTEYRENIGTSSHFRINITATYTFGYGKKVQRGNEVGEQSGANSAIIK